MPNSRADWLSHSTLRFLMSNSNQKSEIKKIKEVSLSLISLVYLVQELREESFLGTMSKNLSMERVHKQECGTCNQENWFNA